MEYGLDEYTIQRICQILSAFPQVHKAVLYGSRAIGNFKPGSDIDLTLQGDNINLSVLSEISLSLDDLLLPYMFDISVFSHLKDEDIISHIEKVGIVFYSRQKNTKQ